MHRTGTVSWLTAAFGLAAALLAAYRREMPADAWLAVTLWNSCNLAVATLAIMRALLENVPARQKGARQP